jgi:hypothetical protein
VAPNSVQGICIPQSLADSDPSLCYRQSSDAYFRSSPNGAAGGGCEPPGDFTALAIGLGTFYGFNLLNSCVLAYVVRSKRSGTHAQTACWFVIGLIFSIMAWYMLQCCGPKVRGSSDERAHAQASPEFSLGSAPPASASVEAAAMYLPFQQQDRFNYQQPGLYSAPPPYNPYMYAPPLAPPHAPQ